MDSPITNDVLEAIANANEIQAKNTQANAPYNEQIQALQIQKLKAEIAEIESKAHKYAAQGELSKSINDSEQINQALTIDEIQKGIIKDNDKSVKTSNKATWQKYPSAQNLDY